MDWMGLDEWIDASGPLFEAYSGRRSILNRVSGSIGLSIDVLLGCSCSGLMAVRKVFGGIFLQPSLLLQGNEDSRFPVKLNHGRTRKNWLYGPGERSTDLSRFSLSVEKLCPGRRLDNRAGLCLNRLALAGTEIGVQMVRCSRAPPRSR